MASLKNIDHRVVDAMALKSGSWPDEMDWWKEENVSDELVRRFNFRLLAFPSRFIASHPDTVVYLQCKDTQKIDF